VSEYFESDHFKHIEDIDEDVEDFVVKVFSQTDSEVGEGGFRGDVLHGYTGMGSIGPAPVFIVKNFKESVHVLVAIDDTKEI